MWDFPRPGIEPVCPALASDSYLLDHQGRSHPRAPPKKKTKTSFLKGLLEQSHSFLFLCGFLVANCSLCCPQVFQTCPWPALSVSWLCRPVWATSAFLGLGAPCDASLTLVMSGGSVLKILRANPYVLRCGTKYRLAHLNLKCMRWVFGFLLRLLCVCVEVVTTFLVFQDNILSSMRKVIFPSN